MCRITVLENFKDGDFKQISSMFLKMGPKGNLQDLVTFKQTSSEDHGNVFIRSQSKPSLKIGSVTKAFLFRYWQRLKRYFFRNDFFFIFQERKLKLLASVWKRIFWDLTKSQLNQTTDRKNDNNNWLNELNELKFCEVSQKSMLKVLLFYLVKGKKVLFLKNIYFYAKIDPKDGACCPDFQWRFWSRYFGLSNITSIDTFI